MYLICLNLDQEWYVHKWESCWKPQINNLNYGEGVAGLVWGLEGLDGVGLVDLGGLVGLMSGLVGAVAWSRRRD